MRQVMPHRNNIGARLVGCKSFLHPLSDCPVNWTHCGILVRMVSNSAIMNYVFISTV
jgi:hypothetical protein